MADDISIISNKVLISQEVTLDEYAAGQSMKEHYDDSQKEYIEYSLNAKEKLVFHYSTDFYLSVLLMANLCSFLQTLFQFVLDTKGLCKENNEE